MVETALAVGTRVSGSMYGQSFTGYVAHNNNDIGSESTLVVLDPESTFQGWGLSTYEQGSSQFGPLDETGHNALPEEGRAYWFNPNALTLTQPTGSEVVTEPEVSREVREMTERIASLETRVSEQVDASRRATREFSNVITVIGEALKAEAERREYCSEYEDAIEEMASSLPYPFADTLRESAVRVTERDWCVTGTVRFHEHVTADSEDDAIEEVTDRLTSAGEDFTVEDIEAQVS